MSKKLLLALATFTAACDPDETQTYEVEVDASISDEARESVETWPAALVATLVVTKQMTPDARDTVEASTTVLAAWCDASEVADVQGVITGAIGPCTEGEVEVELSLVPLLDGSSCEAPLDRIEVASEAFHTELVPAFEVEATCGRYAGAVDVTL
jgi:hypothetical protein